MAFPRMAALGQLAALVARLAAGFTAGSEGLPLAVLSRGFRPLIGDNSFPLMVLTSANARPR